MDAGPLHAMKHPGAWRRAEFERDTSWLLRLTADQSAEMEDAVRAVTARGLRGLSLDKMISRCRASRRCSRTL